MHHHHEIIDFNEMPVKVVISRVEKFKLHWHRSVEILLVLNGGITVTLDGKNYELFEDDVVFINSSQIHSLIHRNDMDNIFIAIQIPIAYFKNKSIDIENLEINCCSRTESRNLPIFQLIRWCIGKIVDELNKGGVAYKLVMESFIDYLIAMILRNFSSSSARRIEDFQDLTRIQNIMEYIDENYQQKIYLSDIAAREHLNVYYLSHFFKDKTGISFQQYLSNVRLKKAYWQIENTTQNITTIALDCGFPNVKALNKMFKEVYNKSPREHRKTLGGFAFHENDKGNFELSYAKYDQVQAINKLMSYTVMPSELHFEQSETTAIENETISISSINPKRAKPFSDYFKNLITFGRAYDCLRAQSQIQLRMLQQEIGFRYIRFHGTFSDEMRVVERNKDGKLVYTWGYLDELFDFFLSIGLKPFMEFTFMPSALKSKNYTVFKYQGNISKPSDLSEWEDLIVNFMKHIINRYGLSEVLSWYFELWNEPDLLWGDDAEDFYEFFAATARAVYSVDSRLKIAGPSIARDGDNLINLDKFFGFLKNNGIHCSCITYHLYGNTAVFENETVEDIKQIRNWNMVLGDKNFINEIVQKNKETIDNFDPNAEVHITEFNISALEGSLIMDTAFMSTFIIETALKNMGKIDSLGFWSASDIFEESSPVDSPFYGGFGMLTKEGIKKPSYWGYWFLNQLGDHILQLEDDFVITRANDDIQILIYNHTYPDKFYQHGDTSLMTPEQRYAVFESKNDLVKTIEFNGITGKYKQTKYVMNRECGSAVDVWIEMGMPMNLNDHETEYIKSKSMPLMKTGVIEDLSLYRETVTVPPFGVYLMVFQKII